MSASATSGNEKTSSGRKVGSRRKDRRASSTVGKARQMLQKQNRPNANKIKAVKPIPALIIFPRRI